MTRYGRREKMGWGPFLCEAYYPREKTANWF